MMAKMFYTLDETKAALGRSEEEIKQFSREGRLREFRDGPRLMFKADQVEALKADLGGTGAAMDVQASDSGAPLGLADSGGIGSGIGSGIGTGIGSGIGTGIGSGIGSGSISLSDDIGQSSGAGMTLKDDTALAADLGLSGSIGGVPSPGRPQGGPGMISGSGLAGSASGASRGGINVLGEDADRVDPMAQTMAPTGGGGLGGSMSGSQFNLEGVGSGSGLLDLTRESDDTSLGAALLDEIQPGKGGRGDTMTGPGVTMEAPRGGVTRGATFIREVEANDELAPAFGAASLGGFIMLLIAALVLASGVVGGPSEIGQKLPANVWGIFGIGLAVAVVLGVIGAVAGKMMKR